MSEPFVIPDTSSESCPVEENNSFKSIQDISPKRMNLYMQQFTNNSSQSAHERHDGHKNRFGRKGFKKRFKKKRIKTLLTSKSNSKNSASNSNDLKYNYYNNDPGLKDSDFNMQWEGISRIGLNTNLE
jgi:hypothetical protein